MISWADFRDATLVIQRPTVFSWNHTWQERWSSHKSLMLWQRFYKQLFTLRRSVVGRFWPFWVQQVSFLVDPSCNQSELFYWLRLFVPSYWFQLQTILDFASLSVQRHLWWNCIWRLQCCPISLWCCLLDSYEVSHPQFWQSAWTDLIVLFLTVLIRGLPFCLDDGWAEDTPWCQPASDVFRCGNCRWWECSLARNFREQVQLVPVTWSWMMPCVPDWT